MILKRALAGLVKGMVCLDCDAPGLSGMSVCYWIN